MPRSLSHRYGRGALAVIAILPCLLLLLFELAPRRSLEPSTQIAAPKCCLGY
jgi:hypothetical protein